ncbi:efflux RND transporter permease subunit [Nostoc sp.]|uniref:efflux RND transporter permease subunit n=1 Tax=Nostoc sp. TaxID=1180 RepID=UPI003FA54AF9
MRENQQCYVSFTGGVEKRDLGSVVQDINKKLAGFKLPQGYILSVGGLIASQQQSFSQLLMVTGLGVLLVYLVLVIQFRNLLQPLVIFTTIPLALLGVVLSLWITQTPLNVSSFMGIILLVGLVVKNGIILLEYTNQLHSEGHSIESALLEAGRVRLRPILMTTLHTLYYSGFTAFSFGFRCRSRVAKATSDRRYRWTFTLYYFFSNICPSCVSSRFSISTLKCYANYYISNKSFL